jgi:phenylalanyl-tRNA synthetase beta chain
MPTITISLSELKSMLKKDIADSQIEEILPLNKLEVEEWGEELKVEATPDRPDLFSVEGIARQLRLWLGLQKGLVKYPLAKPRITIKNNGVDSRPYIVSGVVRGLKLDESVIKSIMQLQEALDFTLGRDRKKISIGLHDSKHIRPPIVYKEAGPSEISFVPLGMDKKMNLKEILHEHPKGMKYKHILTGKKYPILLDSRKQVVSFPPIINGELTKVTEKTKNLFIDITGLDPTPLNYALNILMSALAERGGRLEAVNINDDTTPRLRPRNIRIDYNEPKKLLGLSLKNTQIKSLLRRMGYDIDKSGRVLIPPYRPDILHHVDIIEDIAIAFGFNDIPPEVPRHHSMGRPHELEEFSNTLREMIAGLGFQEVMNYTLTSEEKHFKKMGTSSSNTVKIQNPISSEYSICRSSLLPSLIETLSQNKKRRFPQKIFELGDCIILDRKAETGTRNKRMLAAAVTHSEAEITVIMSILNTLKSNLGLEWKLKNHTHPSFIPGRCGLITLDREEIGIFGEVRPEVLISWGLEKPVACMEIDVDFLREAL